MIATLLPIVVKSYNRASLIDFPMSEEKLSCIFEVKISLSTFTQKYWLVNLLITAQFCNVLAHVHSLATYECIILKNNVYLLCVLFLVKGCSCPICQVEFKVSYLNSLPPQC